MVNVRRASPRDRAEWLRMRAALWPHGRADHAREIDAFLAAPDGRGATFVAERPGGGADGLAGFLEAQVRSHADGCATSPVGYVEGWYVDPEVRRSGVGRALLAAAERWARELGLGELASDSELLNPDGQRAHLALGFEEVGRVVQFRKSLERSA